jgi:uncharacterized protein (TIGR00730 family)
VSLRSVAVYCGSSAGVDPTYLAAARDLGTLLAKQQLTVVYGGGRVGLMGAVADAALAAGGRVHGVITTALLDAEVGHGGLSELEVVDSMHERKARMADLAEGFVALPGGYGTFEELFEVLTWTQLGIHHKPVTVVNINGFWDPTMEQLRRSTDEGFMKAVHRDVLRSATSPAEAVRMLLEPVAPVTPKWL